MINYVTLLAHAGEAHSDGLETIAHTVAPWYFAIPLFIIVISAIGYLTWLVSGRNSHIVLGVVTAALLVSGFTLFTISAAVSAIAITVGLLLAGFQAFTSIIE